MMKTFSASLSQLRTMLKFIREHAGNCGFDDDDISKIEVAVEEAIVNIICYAYPEAIYHSSSQDLATPLDIEITCEPCGNNGITIVIKDHGVAYNPLNPKQFPFKPQVPTDIRPIGGFGIFIITQLMDEVHYYRESNRNVLTLKKAKTH